MGLNLGGNEKGRRRAEVRKLTEQATPGAEKGEGKGLGTSKQEETVPVQLGGREGRRTE